MKYRNKLVLGIILTMIGIIVLVFASSMGLTSLFLPWSFITGFVTGMIITLGVGFLISGLLEIEKK